MSEQHTDPSGNTQAFRAFVQSEEEAPQSSKLPLIIGGVLVAALVLALIVWLAR